MPKLLVILSIVGAVIAFFWLHFVEPNRKLCDEICALTGRISHEDTFGDTEDAKKKQRGDFWAAYPRVTHAFPLSPAFPKAVSQFAGVLEYTADPNVKSANPPQEPFGAAQAKLMAAHDAIEAAAKSAAWRLWQ